MFRHNKSPSGCGPAQRTKQPLVRCSCRQSRAWLLLAPVGWAWKVRLVGTEKKMRCSFGATHAPSLLPDPLRFPDAGRPPEPRCTRTHTHDGAQPSHVVRMPTPGRTDSNKTHAFTYLYASQVPSGRLLIFFYISTIVRRPRKGIVEIRSLIPIFNGTNIDSAVQMDMIRFCSTSCLLKASPIVFLKSTFKIII
jgi:hypothetical protein